MESRDVRRLNRGGDHYKIGNTIFVQHHIPFTATFFFRLLWSPWPRLKLQSPAVGKLLNSLILREIFRLNFKGTVSCEIKSTKFNMQNISFLKKHRKNRKKKNKNSGGCSIQFDCTVVYTHLLMYVTVPKKGLPKAKWREWVNLFYLQYNYLVTALCIFFIP